MIAFRAMNTDVTVLAPEASTASEAHIAEQVQQVFAESERIFSRFQANSELSRLNQAGGPVTVSANCNAAFTVGYATPRRASEKLTSHW
jgi:thiamine biosynthesis lipoprotein ApbE